MEWSPEPPPEAWMTESDFEQLAARIKARAKTEHPMALAEIRDFRPAGAA